MVFFLRDNDDEVLEGNIYYWKIRKLLKDISSAKSNGVTMAFKLHSKIWRIFLVDNKDGHVYVDTCSFNEKCARGLFDLRVGIVGDDLKEIVVIQGGFMVRLITRPELYSILLSNQVLYLFTEISRKDEKVQKMKDRKEQTERDYRDLLLSGKNSDVTLKVKNKKFYCHRCILSARSPVFADMMKNNMDEKGSGKVIVEYADPDVFKKFLLFLYTGKEDYLSWQNVTDLYELADKYGVEDIKSVCRNDIKEKIGLNNFCDFFKFSLLHNDSELNNVCRDVLKKYICSSNFCELFKLSVQLSDSELTKKTVHFFLRNSKLIVQFGKWMEFLSEDSKKWLSVDHIKEIITAENFFFFFKLSQIQNHPELAETTVQFFLKNSKDITKSENWMTFLAENLFETNILITALIEK